MKFLFPQDKVMFEYLANKEGSEDHFIQKRKGLISQLKDFRKSAQQKHNWRANRWKHLVGLRRFHRSTEGKKFHRKLGDFLANRHFGNKSSKQSENYELILALSSLQTHALLESEYFMEILEACEYEEFTDYLIGEIGTLFVSLQNETFDFNEWEEFLLRLCETNAVVQSFADKTGKSVDTIEKYWKDIKQGLLDSGKKEDEDGFYAILVSTLKKKLDLNK